MNSLPPFLSPNASQYTAPGQRRPSARVLIPTASSPLPRNHSAAIHGRAVSLPTAAVGKKKSPASLVGDFFSLNCPDIFFRFQSGNHQLMAAALTFQAKIRSGAQYFPALFAAWVGFFHNKNIIQANIHRLTPS